MIAMIYHLVNRQYCLVYMEMEEDTLIQTNPLMVFSFFPLAAYPLVGFKMISCLNRQRAGLFGDPIARNNRQISQIPKGLIHRPFPWGEDMLFGSRRRSGDEEELEQQRGELRQTLELQKKRWKRWLLMRLPP